LASLVQNVQYRKRRPKRSFGPSESIVSQPV
jgi:hypothetical protein